MASEQVEKAQESWIFRASVRIMSRDLIVQKVTKDGSKVRQPTADEMKLVGQKLSELPESQS